MKLNLHGVFFVYCLLYCSCVCSGTPRQRRRSANKTPVYKRLMSLCLLHSPHVTLLSIRPEVSAINYDTEMTFPEQPVILKMTAVGSLVISRSHLGSFSFLFFNYDVELNHFAMSSIP